MPYDGQLFSLPPISVAGSDTNAPPADLQATFYADKRTVEPHSELSPVVQNQVDPKSLPTIPVGAGVPFLRNLFLSGSAVETADPPPISPARDIENYSMSRTIRDEVFDRAGRVSARLVSLSGYSRSIDDYLNGDNHVKNSVIINFPAMPEVIELARTTEYRVSPTFVLPDGIHVYKHTNPLEIPITFKLSMYDQEYCTQGALTLLMLAARLHALTLPISASNSGKVSADTVGELRNPDVSKTEPGLEQRADESNLNRSKNFIPPSFPVACMLDLIYTGTQSPGIRCVGYIKNASVKLKGPFLQTMDRTQKNLPSSAEYSFVFVHRPGHTNVFGNTATDSAAAHSGLTYDLGFQINAYADDVKSKLYNTVGLLKDTAMGYQGFKD
jgi:hypothetical protein